MNQNAKNFRQRISSLKYLFIVCFEINQILKYTYNKNKLQLSTRNKTLSET